MSDVASSTEVEELKARLARLEQTAQTHQGGTVPHAGVLAGHPLHTILGPVDEAGKVLEGAWNTITGLWENPEEAERSRKQREDEKAAAEQAARDQVQEANRQKAIEIAKQRLAEEGDLERQVQEQMEQIRGSSSPPQPSSPSGGTQPGPGPSPVPDPAS